MASTKKFTAAQFTKHGFIHLKEEDFSDDGARFQVWAHEETGLKVTYSRLADAYGDGEAEVFISVHTWGLGLDYVDYSELDHYRGCDAYNGAPESEVDLDDLVKIMCEFAAEVAEAKKRIESEELDMTAVIERVEFERKCAAQVLKLVKSGVVEWWTLKEYKFNTVKRSIERLEQVVAKADEILANGFGDKAAERKAWNFFHQYDYVVDKCDEGSKYSAYGELYALVMGE